MKVKGYKGQRQGAMVRNNGCRTTRHVLHGGRKQRRAGDIGKVRLASGGVALRNNLLMVWLQGVAFMNCHVAHFLFTTKREADCSCTWLSFTHTKPRYVPSECVSLCFGASTT